MKNADIRKAFSAAKRPRRHELTGSPRRRPNDPPQVAQCNVGTTYPFRQSKSFHSRALCLSRPVFRHHVFQGHRAQSSYHEKRVFRCFRGFLRVFYRSHRCLFSILWMLRGLRRMPATTHTARTTRPRCGSSDGSQLVEKSLGLRG